MIKNLRLQKGKIKQALDKTIKQFVMIFISFIILFPLYFVFNGALKERIQFMQEPLTLSVKPFINNFLNVLNHPNLGRWFLNSTLLTIGSGIICIIFAIMAAYALATMRFKGKNFLENLITMLMVIPPIVMIIPLFIFFRMLNMVSNLWGLTILYSGLTLPFSIFLLKSFFVTIPKEITEAAVIDGCSTTQVLLNIFLPLSKPALVTTVIVNAVWVWNELLLALVFLQKEELRTVIVGITISLQKRFTLDVPAIFAGLAIATIPMIFIYAIGQNALVRGLTSGFEK